MSSVENAQFDSLLSNQSITNKDSELIKPSIFDVIAQEDMNKLFRTAFTHFFNWLTSNSKFSRFTKYKKYRDYIYLLSHSFIELMYLKAYDALFSEHFYGLKRVHLKNNSLNNFKRVLSIVFSLIIPYIKAKIDEVYEDLERIADQLDDQDNTIKNKLKGYMLKIYPYFNLIWHSIFWYFRFKYIIGKNEFFNSPLLRVLNLRLVYDLNDQKNEISNGFISKVLQKSSFVFTSLMYSIQFYQWYEQYNEEESFNNNSNNIISQGLSKVLNGSEQSGQYSHKNIIAPPILPNKIAQSNAYKKIVASNLCPLCTKTKKNQCVLNVSGFVFCYICIFKFVKEHSRCPLTDFPCSIKNIIRIYDVAD